MPPRDLHERTRLFALAVLTFCRRLPDSQEADEGLASWGVRRTRCAQTIAQRRGRSRAEFRAKRGTVFEEADECADCLEYFRDAKIRHDAALIREAGELASIFAKSVSTARQNAKREKKVPNS